MKISRQKVGLIVNAAAFQAVWFVTVTGAVREAIWPGVLALVAFLVVNRVMASSWRADLLLAGTAVVLGWVVETLIVRSGLLSYAFMWPSPELAPAWLLILWAALALALNGCLAWLKSRPVLAGCLGALGGPLSYYAGHALGAATAPQGLERALAVVGAVYALATPGLLALAARMHSRPADASASSR